MKCARFFLRSVLLAALVLPIIRESRADDPAAATQAVAEDSAAQAAIRKQSAKIQQSLLQLAAELRQNGLESSDSTILATVASHLSSLNAGDMQKVLDALHGADAATDAQGRERSLADAYQAQKNVALRLQGLATELAAEEASSGLTTELEKLIVRQSSNLRRTTHLVREKRPADRLDERQQAVHTMASAEQAAIGGGIDQELGAVTSAAAAPAGSPAASLAQAVLGVAKSLPLQATGAAATQFMQAGPFTEALTQENTLRQDLNQLLQAALSGQSAMTRLEQAQAELQRLVSSQQDLIAASKQNRTDGDTLAETELEIDDESQVALALLRAISGDAVTQLGQAQGYMVDSSGELSRARDTSTAVAREQLVIDTLAQAQKVISQQIAATQAAEKDQAPLDAMAQAQKLQQEVRQAEQTAATNPQQTADDLKKMQQQAFAVSPAAAAQMADAADQLQPNVAKNDEAPNLNQTPNPAQTPNPGQAPAGANPPAGAPPAQTPAQTAAADLARADDALQQKINSLAQPAQQAAAIAQAQQQVSQALQAATQAGQDIQPNGPQPADVPRNLADAAADAAKAAQNASASAAANQALQQAAAALQQGSQQAVQGNAAAAQASAQQGKAALQQAQAALGQAMSQLQQQGQTPNQGGQSLLGGQAPRDTSNLLTGSGPEGGTAQVVGALTPQERAAITQYQEEKQPPEYAPLVEQYLKNLANYRQTQ